MSSSSAQTQDMSAALEPSSGYKPFLVEKEGALWEVALAAFWFFALATAHAYLQPIRYLLVLGFLAAIAFHYRQFLTNSVKLWFLYLYPAWAMMSFMWADSRNEAFRYGALQTVFVLILIYVASRLTMHQIIRALFWAFVLMGLQVFIEIPVIDAYTMPEGFGEKNMLASRMFFLFTACLYMLYTRRSLLIEKGLALVCAPLSFFVIIIAESATSLVLAILSAFVLTSVASIWQAVTRVRALSSLVLLFFAVSAVLLVLVSFSLFSQGPVNAFLDAVGKDATLTGRTELWQAASEQVAKKPWLGVGAESFWLVNRGEVVQHVEADHLQIAAHIGCGLFTGVGIDEGVRILFNAANAPSARAGRIAGPAIVQHARQPGDRVAHGEPVRGVKHPIVVQISIGNDGLVLVVQPIVIDDLVAADLLLIGVIGSYIGIVRLGELFGGEGGAGVVELGVGPSVVGEQDEVRVGWGGGHVALV